MPTGRIAALSAALGAALVFAACGDDQVKLGPPDGLQGKHPQDDPPDAGVPATMSPGDGGPQGMRGACSKPADAAACPTFTVDIFPKLFAPAAWGCSSGGAGGTACHGPGQNPPALDTASGAYTALTTMTWGGSPPIPYVNKGSVDCAQSFIVRDVNPTTGSMPFRLAAINNHKATADELATLETWLACGAPQ